MQTTTFRQRAMLLCVLLLFAVMGSILLRAATKVVMMDGLHMDNALTGLVFFDGADKEEDPPIKHLIAWNLRYPFSQEKKASLPFLCSKKEKIWKP